MAKIIFKGEATKEETATPKTWRIILTKAGELINFVGGELTGMLLYLLSFLFIMNPVAAFIWSFTFPRAYADWFSKDQTTRSISGWVIKRLGWKIRQWFVKAKPDYFAVTDQLRAWREDQSMALSVEAKKELTSSYPSDADIALLFKRKDYDLIAKIMMKKTIGEIWVRTLLARAEEDPEAKSLAIFAARQYGISQELLADVINGKCLDEALKRSIIYASSVRNQRLAIGSASPEIIAKIAKNILPEAQSALDMTQYMQFKQAGGVLNRIAILELLRRGANKYTAQIFKSEPAKIFSDSEIQAVIENDYRLIEQYYAAQ